MVRIHPCPPRMSSVAVCGAFLVRERHGSRRSGQCGWRQDESSAAGGRSGRHCPGAARRALAQGAHGSSRRQDERKSLETARAAHVSRLFAVLQTYGHYRHSLTRQEKVSPSALRPAACLPSKRASLIFRMSSSCSLAAEKMTALPPSGVSPSTGVMASWRR